MLLISHRGNLSGPNLEQENSEPYIMAAISAGFDVETDLWGDDSGQIYLGHDRPTYKTSSEFLSAQKDKLWIHCKNLKVLDLISGQVGFNYFWHQTDDYTLTSKGYIWTYPGKLVLGKNILVVWERLAKDKLPNCLGICSDYVNDYK
ncbi:MAG: hypothetical protein A3J93_01195 [Candidatus Magasanikbacteria bacterium RIFOXYC2_FULL_42_28]|uniref:GP-PDE domain-containing protein n=1 Tax=Candidatus Magasanikbacteria bacterium RIFOXYC2_FULL_42_28 TaxID=1798704 RepID=A0A1F6NYG3_9BACT|nr:MAG: hypothetical protein A3J93_01195 [Candidatus Magasanikbacteria bacterium RIFOXYC2_FULL_42_28]